MQIIQLSFLAATTARRLEPPRTLTTLHNPENRRGGGIGAEKADFQLSVPGDYSKVEKRSIVFLSVARVKSACLSGTLYQGYICAAAHFSSTMSGEGHRAGLWALSARYSWVEVLLLTHGSCTREGHYSEI